MKEHLFILKCMHKASPFYLFVNLSEVVVSYLSFALLLPFNRYIVNKFLDGEADWHMIAVAFSFFLAVRSSGFFTYWVTQVYNQLQYKRIEKYMNGLVYGKCQWIDVACYEDTDFYNQYVRALEDGPQRVTKTAGILCTFVSSLLRVGTVVGLFASLDMVFCVVAALYCVQGLAGTKRNNQIFYRANLEETPVHRKSSYINRIFGSRQYAEEVKLYRLHDFLTEKFTAAKLQLRELKKQRITELLRFLFTVNLTGSLLHLAVNFLVIYRIIEGRFTVGDFTVVFVAVNAMADSLTGIFNVVPDTKHNQRMIALFRKLLDYEPTVYVRAEGVRGEGVRGGVCLSVDGVSFAYPNRPEAVVLQDVSVRIAQGEKVAIVGRNGSGKSTFLKLLLGFYEPGAGEVTLNGRRVSAYDRDSFYGAFGVVFQDVQIYCTTVAENVLFRNEWSKEDEKRVWAALEFSGLGQKVRSLEKGIHTAVTKEFDQGGVYFSGGEYQRLAIARAYARDPKVLLFDEPASALDAIAEREIMDRLYELGRGKTVICVSHRLSSTIGADRILVFDEGRIVESGSHRELMDRQGVYYDMFLKQTEGYRL